MNNCGIIKDLLPLYVDEVVSEESKKVVEEHIKTCGACKNQLINMKGEIRYKARENDNAKINVMKSLKKKIFRKNIIIASVSSLVAFVILFAGFSFIFHFDRPIEYSDGLIRAEINRVDGGTPVLDILYANGDYYMFLSTERIINRNGENVKVMYFYITETISTRVSSNIRNSDRLMRFITPLDSYGQEIELDRIEVYYLIGNLEEVNRMSDEEFDRQRENGILIWSGNIE